MKASIYENIPASFPRVSMGWAAELIVINFAQSELCSLNLDTYLFEDIGL